MTDPISTEELVRRQDNYHRSREVYHEACERFAINAAAFEKLSNELERVTALLEMDRQDVQEAALKYEEAMARFKAAGGSKELLRHSVEMGESA